GILPISPARSAGRCARGGTENSLATLSCRHQRQGDRHGIWPRVIVLAAWYSASDHHSAGLVLAQLIWVASPRSAAAVSGGLSFPPCGTPASRREPTARRPGFLSGGRSSSQGVPWRRPIITGSKRRPACICRASAMIPSWRNSSACSPPNSWRPRPTRTTCRPVSSITLAATGGGAAGAPPFLPPLLGGAGRGRGFSPPPLPACG